MDKKVLIFGTQDTASLAHFYFKNDSEYQVEAFVVDKQYLNKDEFCGLPVVAFEDVDTLYPKEYFDFFAPIYATNMNKTRKKIYDKIKLKGYNFISYISSKAVVWDRYQIGENSFILEGVNIQPFSKVGNNNIIWSFSHLGHHSIIKDNVFVSTNVVIAGKCTINDYCFLGTNSSTREGLNIAEGTFLAMGAAIIDNSEPYSIYKGIPAKKTDNKTSLDINLTLS